MDIKQAFEKLDSVRPDSDDVRDPDFADAVRLIESNADEESCFHDRLNFDRKISAAMQDVAVPADLKDKLLAQAGLTNSNATSTALPENAEDTNSDGKHSDNAYPDNVRPDNARPEFQSSAPAVSPLNQRTVRNSRRGWLFTAAGLLVAVCSWLLWPTTQISAADLLATVPLESTAFQKLSAFNGPTTNEIPYAAQFRQTYGWSSTDNEPHDVALFEFRGRSGKRCVLLAIPDHKLTDPASLTSATLSITRVQAFTARGWQVDRPSGNFVCVLFIEGSGAELEFEIRNLQGSVS